MNHSEKFISNTLSELETAQLLAELEKLRKENDELRKRPNSEHSETLQEVNLSVQLALSSDNSSLPEVNNKSKFQDKVSLFRNLFKGRDDVYAVRWTNEQNGKKGYAPSTIGFAKKKGPKQYHPIDDQVIYEHLSGTKIVGLYPLLNNHTCYFLACDFDDDGWTLDSLAYLQACQKYQIPVYLERSRSGNGGHAWIFFSEAVPAISVRQLGMRLLRITMEFRGEMDLGSYDRFFPNQDYMPKGGFGNLIALPLQKKSRSLGNSEFLNTEGKEWIPFSDQWEFLSKVKRLNNLQVEALLEIIPEVHLGTESLAIVSENVRKKNPAPNKIKCVRDAAVNLEKSGIPPWMLSRFKHLASFSNPKFYEKQKLRLSVFQTPRVIKCYEEDVFKLSVPRGLFDKVSDFCKESGSVLDINDLRPKHKKLDFIFSGQLTETQSSSIQNVLKKDMGILVAPPGAGKTVMGCFAVAMRNIPTLILAHRKPLLEQWRSQLMTFLGLKSKEIGQIGGGRKRQTEKIDLAMLQSLGSLDDLDNLFQRYGFIIVDECHHLPAFSFETCIKKANVRYILGLTATPYRRDGLQEILTMNCGPIQEKIKSNSDMLIRTLHVHDTDFHLEDSDTLPIQTVFKELVLDTARNKQIVEDVLSCLKNGRRCLILTQRKEHAEILRQMLLEKDKNSIVLTGDLGKKERVACLDSLRQLPAKNDFLAIATGQYLGEGFDCPQIDTLFLSFPVSFKGKLIQYVGRILRTFPGKSSAEIHDYCDVEMPVLQKMFTRREKTYDSLEFQIFEENTQNKLVF